MEKMSHERIPDASVCLPSIDRVTYAHTIDAYQTPESQPSTIPPALKTEELDDKNETQSIAIIQEFKQQQKTRYD